MGLFNKLRQVSSATDFEDQFEELRALVVAKQHDFSCVSGLREYIKGAGKIFHPQTLGDVVFLAKQVEAKSSKSSLNSMVKGAPSKPI